MTQKKRLTQLVVALVVAASGNAAYAAESTTISVDINYWKPGVKSGSEMRVPNSTSIDLKNDLGLKDKNSLSLTVNYKPNANQTWYVGGDGVNIKNSKILTKAINLNNTNFVAGNSLSSELKVSHYQIGLRSNWSSNSNFYTNYQLNRSSVKTTIVNNTTSEKQSRENNGTSLGLGLGWQTKNANQVNFFAEINPLSLFGSNAYWEHKIGIKAPVSESMQFTLGYKTENFRAGKDAAKNRTNVDLRGLYFSLGGNF